MATPPQGEDVVVVPDWLGDPVNHGMGSVT
jgi:hypothetical protein